MKNIWLPQKQRFSQTIETDFTAFRNDSETSEPVGRFSEITAFRDELPPVGSVAMNMYINMLNGCYRVRLSRTQVT